jgi:hypothetical protein
VTADDQQPTAHPPSSQAGLASVRAGARARGAVQCGVERQTDSIAYLTQAGHPIYRIAVCDRRPGHDGPHQDKSMRAYAWSDERTAP